MSGTFKDMNVPPTLVSFAVDTVNVKNVVSPEFKKPGSLVVLIRINKDALGLPDFKHIEKTYTGIHNLISSRKVLSASALKTGGIAESISKMTFGNDIGFKAADNLNAIDWFKPDYGSIILELDGENSENMFKDLDYQILGSTINEPVILINDISMSLEALKAAWESTLEKIFPTRTQTEKSEPLNVNFTKYVPIRSSEVFARPRVFIPVFPGTNCEYDTANAFERAGAVTDVFVMRNLNPSDIEASVKSMKEKIENSQIIMIPGGFSAGDEPEGSGKFIATVFKNPYLSEAIMKLLKQRDGLILGICNGFQALIKLGLLPYGEIRDLDDTSPTLTFNTIGRHVSCLVKTKVVSSLSPWLSKTVPGDIHTIAISHGEGRFIANDSIVNELVKYGQIATQYVDQDGNPTYDIRFNPNGSVHAVEGITSRDGRIFGKMGHTERYTSNTFINVPGDKEQKLFEAGVEYFK